MQSHIILSRFDSVISKIQSAHHFLSNLEYNFDVLDLLANLEHSVVFPRSLSSHRDLQRHRDCLARSSRFRVDALRSLTFDLNILPKFFPVDFPEIGLLSSVNFSGLWKHFSSLPWGIYARWNLCYIFMYSSSHNITIPAASWHMLGISLDQFRLLAAEYDIPDDLLVFP